MAMPILAIARIDQQAVFEFADDILRPTNLGRHHRQAMRRSLDQSQPVGLHQRRIDEYAAGFRCKGIQRLDLLAAVRLGIGDAAVEIVAVDRIDQPAQHLLLLLRATF